MGLCSSASAVRRSSASSIGRRGSVLNPHSLTFRSTPHEIGTVLLDAATVGDMEALNIALTLAVSHAQRKDCLDFRDTTGRTPLMQACFWGHTDAVEALVAAGANVNLADGLKQTAAMCAAQNGQADALASLIIAVPPPSPSIPNSEHADDTNGEDGVSKQDDMNDHAEEDGDGIDTAISLSDVPATITEENEFGVTSDETPNPAIHKLNMRKLHSRLERRANLSSVDSRGWRALHFAAHSGTPAVIMLCVDNGSDINATDFYGNTALHTAAAAWNVVNIKALLACRADTEVRNHQGQTAVDVANDREGDDSLRAEVVDALTDATP